MSANNMISGSTLAELLLANAQDPDPDDGPTTAASGDSLPVFTNWEWDETGEKPKKRGMALSDICYTLEQLTNDWPRRVEKTLFVPGANHEPRYLDTPAQLFAWLDA